MTGSHIINADGLTALRSLPDAVAQTCVTSPPYYGLRDYGVDSQIGLEQSPEEYIARLVEIFAEVRRVLRDDGTLWVVIGDAYGGGRSGRSDGGRIFIRPDGSPDKFSQKHSGIRLRRGNGAAKRKDLIGTPWMLAFALRADGWYLRQDIIWHKPNPMPESMSDRPTRAHEYIFLLSKSARYYYNHEAIKEPAIDRRSRHPVGGKCWRSPNSGVRKPGGQRLGGYTTKNKRSVWTVSTSPYKGAHFAVFPPTLIRPCILAGSRPGDIVLDPFFGAGTTGVVAQDLGREFIGIDINADYCELARKRIFEKPKQLSLCFGGDR